MVLRAFRKLMPSLVTFANQCSCATLVRKYETVGRKPRKVDVARPQAEYNNAVAMAAIDYANEPALQNDINNNLKPYPAVKRFHNYASAKPAIQRVDQLLDDSRLTVIVATQCH